MSGILRQLVCFCFLGLIVGSLWLFAASSNVPSIPPWRGEAQKKLTRHSQSYQQTAVATDGSQRFDHDFDEDVNEPTAATAATFDDDEQGEYARRST